MDIFKEISLWRNEKLLPAKYIDILEKKYRNEAEKKSSRFSFFIVAIGALLFGLGILTYMSANWEVFSKLTKTLFLLGSLVGSYAAALYFRWKELPSTSIAFFLLGSVLFGANIMLIAQTFNIQSHYPNGVLIWWMGIAPLAYLLRSKILFFLTFSLFLLWIFLEYLIGFFDLSINPYVILFSFLLFFSVLLVVAFALRERAPQYISLVRNVGLMGIFLFLFFLTLDFFTIDDLSDIFENFQFLPIDLFLFGGVLFLILVGLFSWLFFQRRDHTSHVFSLLSVALLFGGSPLIFGFFPEVFSFFFMDIFWGENLFLLLGKILFLSLSLLTVNLGVKLQKNALIHFGLAFFSLEVMYIYFDFAQELMDTALFFLSFGAFLLLFGYFLEKKRKALIIPSS